MATRTKKIHQIGIKNKAGEIIQWNAKKVRYEIENNDKAVINALLRVYSWQTEEEKQASTTIEYNNRGFNGADSYILSKYAEFYNRNRFLSEKQLTLARKRLVKYSEQIFRDIVNKNS